MDTEQGLFLFHAFARFDLDAVYDAITRGFEFVLHFHGFENEQDLSFFDRLPFGNRDCDDQPGHGRLEMKLARFSHAATGCGA